MSFTYKKMRILILLPMLMPSLLYAQEAVEVLSPIRVEPEPGRLFRQSGVKDQKIYTGKKNTQVSLEEKEPLASNNYRQVATQVPGLTVSEVNNESHASITYRGLGDPHESFNLITLEDDIPISADLYGYPAAYYQTPMDFVDSFEFLRGGSALMFGPQSGGALNFRTREPGPKAFQSRLRLLGGEFGYLQSYAEVSGQLKRTSYLLNIFTRESDGFRDSNGDYEVYGFNLKLGYQFNSKFSMRLKVQDYTGRHGEAGGLAQFDTAGAISINQSRTATTSLNDRLEIDRTFYVLGFDFNSSADQEFTLDVWTSDLSRNSYRQDYAAGQAVFGTVKQGTTNDITLQEFENFGARIKGATDFSNVNWTYGYMFYQNTNPLENQTGPTTTAREGVRQLLVERKSLSHSLFTEVSIALGDWTLVPGLRLDSIQQELDEQFRISGSLEDADNENNVLLYGFGIERKLASKWKLFANSSSGYTPALFAEAFPVNPSDQINDDLDPSRILNHELGVVGEFGKAASTEISTFYITNSNQIGRVGNQFLNVGDAEYYGVEGILIFDPLREWTMLSHSLQILLAYSYLQASFESDSLGDTPQYSPDHTVRWSFSYLHPSDVTVSLSGQWLTEHFGDDANSDNFRIPAYSVWDLGAEIPLGVDDLNLQLAVRNLFNEKYFARIRSNGIEPGQPRIASLGLEYHF